VWGLAQALRTAHSWHAPARTMTLLTKGTIQHAGRRLPVCAATSVLPAIYWASCQHVYNLKTLTCSAQLPPNGVTERCIVKIVVCCRMVEVQLKDPSPSMYMQMRTPAKQRVPLTVTPRFERRALSTLLKAGSNVSSGSTKPGRSSLISSAKASWYLQKPGAPLASASPLLLQPVLLCS
jgi:hypothetical protein